MTKRLTNVATSTFGDGTLICTRARGLDVDWTAFGPKVNGCYRYVMRTWVPSGTHGYLPSDSRHDVEVIKTDEGWAVVLFDEVQDGRYTDKGYAQSAAEQVALVAP